MKVILVIGLYLLTLIGYSQGSEYATVHDDVLNELIEEKELALKHNFKSVTEYIIENPKKQDSLLINRKEYNVEGNIIKKINAISGDLKNTYTTSYKYDTLGRINETIRVSSESSYISLYKFRFSKNGNRLELYYDFGTRKYLEFDKFVYTFHEDGRINSKEFNKELYAFGFFNYIYDLKNQLINISGNRKDSVPSIIYDDNGNITLVKMENGSNQFFIYDDKGLVIEEYLKDQYNKIKSHSKTTYKYNENDMPIEQSLYTGSGKLKFSNTFEYNDKKLLTKLVSYNKKGVIKKIYKYHYTYQK